MKRILSVLLATTLVVTNIIPAFAVTYERDESFENAYEVSERCNDFYKKSNNNYVVENGFLFDLDTQTIVQFDKNIYLETLIDKMLDGTTKEFVSLRDFEKINTVTIPETIAGKTVRFIGNHSFEDARINQVVIPSSVEKIGDYAFWGNPLTNVILNEGLLEIGRYVFNLNGVEDGTLSIVVPSSVKYIDTQQSKGGLNFILKNPDTKVNEIGTAAEYYNIIKKESYTVDPSATLPTEKKYILPENSLVYLDPWCKHTEKNGFTYGYLIFGMCSCTLCGNFFHNVTDAGECPFCKRQISEADGTLIVAKTALTEFDSSIMLPDFAEQHRLFEEKHNGMDLREYVIDRLKTAGLITDEYTALATDEEINTFIDEQIPESASYFIWKNGAMEANSLMRYIISYDSSLDETPEEITISPYDMGLSSTKVFDNLDKIQTVNLGIEAMIAFAGNHRDCFSLPHFPFDISSDRLSFEQKNLLGFYNVMTFFQACGSIKLFKSCENIKTINILGNIDYSGMTEAEIALVNEKNSDYINLILKRMIAAGFENLTLPNGFEYVDGAIYTNNRTQLVAVIKDMETYEMPSTVTTVNNFAFSDRTLKNVIWSENCTYVPVACFAKSNIQNIDLKNVTEIRDLAFYGSNILTLNLPESLTKLGTMVFAKSQLENIEFPKSLTQSGYSLFSGCLNLSSVTLRSNINLRIEEYSMVFGISKENPLTGTDPSFKLFDEYYLFANFKDSLLGFVPNLSNLHFSADVTDITNHSNGITESKFSTKGIGYMPSITNITVDENNLKFRVYKGFLLEKDQYSDRLENVILAPNGMNFYKGNEVPLWLFTPNGFSTEYGDIDLPSAYYKPINSVVASTTDCYIVGMDINHLYMDDNKKINELPNEGRNICQFWWFLFAPNYFHSNADLSALVARNQIPNTVTVINEARKITINTEDNSKAEATLNNVTGKIYEIPFYTELTNEDIFCNGDYCEYSGREEYISVSPDLIGNKPLIFGHDFGADNIVKALRINGDIDLQANNFLQTMSAYLPYAEAYNFELTPNSAKSMFKDNAQMQAQIDKYTWNDGFLHFKEGFKYPILQCENPTDEIILDFVYNFLLPWKATVEGKSLELTFEESEMEELMQLDLNEKLIVVDKDGFEIEDIVYENFYFEYWIMMNYSWAKKYSTEFLNQSNITTFSEFKDWYINTLVFFDEETRTLEAMIGIKNNSYAGAFSEFSHFYPSHINGVPVEHISLSTLINPLFGQVGGSYMYIPSTVKDVGYVSPNSSRYQEEIMAYMMLGEENGIYLTREKVKEKSEKVKLPTISLSYAPDSASTLLNCFGLYSNAESTYISPHNKYFKKLTSAGIQILSKDETICYLATAPSPSSKTTVYAPAAFYNGDYYNPFYFTWDVIGRPAEFQSVNYTVGMDWAGLGCADCYMVLKDGESICPLCGSAELVEVNESMSENNAYGATWCQKGDEEMKCSTVKYFSEASPFAEHCKKEHNHADANKVCCLKTTEGIESWTIEDREAYYETVASYNEYVLSESTIKFPDTYSLTTDSGALSYSNGQIFEKQIFMVIAPDKYRDGGYVIVEPFQMSKEVNLELKKGTVNLSVYDLDNEEYYIGKADFDVYNAENNTLFTTISMTNGAASSAIPYGEYYIVPHEIKGYAFEVERLPLSITEDGQIVNLSFNISVQPSYSLHIPEFLQATKAGEATVNGEVSLKDVVLPKTKSLNVKVAYSGKLKEKSNESDTLSYILYSNNTAITNNSRILNVPYGTNHATIPIHAQITDEVLYAGVYTDTATFTVDVV